MLAKSSRKDRKLREFLEKHDLAEYIEAFQKEEISYYDLEFLESDDVEGLFTKESHQRRFLKSVKTLETSKSPKKKGAGSVKKKERESKKKEGTVNMHVKCKHEVRKIFEIPLGLTNEELIGKLLQEFIECQVKLPGEKIPLVKGMENFTVKDWKKKNEVAPGKLLRAVLIVEGAILEAGGSKEKLEKLQTELDELKGEKEKLEVSLKHVLEGARGKKLMMKLLKKGEKVDEKKSVPENEKLMKELEKLKTELGEVKKEKSTLEKSLKQVKEEAAAIGVENKKLKSELENGGRKKKKSKLKGKKTKKPWLKKLEKILGIKEPPVPVSMEIIALKKKEREARPSFTIPQGFKCIRGILVPQNVVFDVNHNKYYALLVGGKPFVGILSKGNKVATGIGYPNSVCFKASTVFTAGMEYYFQVSATVKYGGNMAFGGILSGGEVTSCHVNENKRGCFYHCYLGDPPDRIEKLIHHVGEEPTVKYGNVSKGAYGPKRTAGKHVFGIHCDFTKKRGEVSFIVDGENWGVAIPYLEPPVSPAFYLRDNIDSFEIEEITEVPDCV